MAAPSRRARFAIRDASAARQLCSGDRMSERLPHRVEAASQLVGVHFGQPLVHDRAALLACFDDVRADIGERRAWQSGASRRARR